MINRSGKSKTHSPHHLISTPLLFVLHLTFNGCATTHSYEAFTADDPLLAAPAEVIAQVEEQSANKTDRSVQVVDPLLTERKETKGTVTPTLLPTIPVEPPCCPTLLETEESLLTENQCQKQCETEIEALKEQTQMQTKKLERQLENLQTTLANNSDSMHALKVELSNSENKVSRLADRVDFYREEVKRLEQLMHAQHASDLVLLDSLTQQVDGLLLRANESLSK